MSQLLTLLWLRYTVFKNTLRSRREMTRTAFNVIFTGGYLVFSLLAGLGLFLAVVLVADFRELAAKGAMPGLLGLLFYLIMFTQTTGSSAHFDPRRFVLFPVRLGKLFLLNLISAPGELVMITILPSVAGLLLGLGVARQEPVAGAVAFLTALIWIDALFVLISLFTAWLFAGRRRSTEVIVAVVLGIFLIASQTLPLMAESATLRALWEWLSPYWEPASGAAGWTPLGVWAEFFGLLDRGETRAAYARLLAVSLGWAGAAMALGYAIFSRLATRPQAGTSHKPGAGGAARGENFLGLRLPFLSEQVSVILAKEWRYFTRNTAIYLNLFTTLLITLIAFGPSGQQRPDLAFGGEFSQWWDGFRVAAWVAYALAVNSQHFVNVFAFDGAGFRHYLLAPARWRRILVGKNLAAWLLLAAQVVMILAGAQLLYDYLTWGKVLIAACSMAIAGSVYTIIGNYLSTRFPYRAEFGVRVRRSTQQFSATNMAAVFGMFVGTGGLLAAPFAAGMLLRNQSVKYLLFPLLGALCGSLYVLLLNRQSALLERNRYLIAESLASRDERTQG